MERFLSLHNTISETYKAVMPFKCMTALLSDGADLIRDLIKYVFLPRKCCP